MPRKSGGTVDDVAWSLRSEVPSTESSPRAERSVRLHAPTEPKAGLSFPEFYRQCAPGLVAFVQWLGAGIHEADDVAQETMARAYRSWESIEHPRTWIRTVA
jgi:RNA polymerase sigma-70 factor (ECF subfamily)